MNEPFVCPYQASIYSFAHRKKKNLRSFLLLISSGAFRLCLYDGRAGGAPFLHVASFFVGDDEWNPYFKLILFLLPTYCRRRLTSEKKFYIIKYENDVCARDHPSHIGVASASAYFHKLDRIFFLGNMCYAIEQNCGRQNRLR